VKKRTKKFYPPRNARKRLGAGPGWVPGGRVGYLTRVAGGGHSTPPGVESKRKIQNVRGITRGREKNGLGHDLKKKEEERGVQSQRGGKKLRSGRKRGLRGGHVWVLSMVQVTVTLWRRFEGKQSVSG